MQQTALVENTNVGQVVNVEKVMQEVAEHKGCGTSGGNTVDVHYALTRLQ